MHGGLHGIANMRTVASKSSSQFHASQKQPASRSSSFIVGPELSVGNHWGVTGTARDAHS